MRHHVDRSVKRRALALAALLACGAAGWPEEARGQGAGDPALPGGVGQGTASGSSTAHVSLEELGLASESRKDGPLARMRARMRARLGSGSPQATSLGALGGTTPEGGPPDAAPMASLTPEKAFEAHIDLGRASEGQKRHGDAVSHYRRALELAGSRGADARGRQALAHRKLAGALDRQGKLAESAPHHEAALKLAPGDPKTWNDAGYSAYLRGDLAAAEERLRQAAKLAPDDPLIQNNLGLALGAAGRREAAAGAFSRAVGPAAAHANLGYILAATGSRDAARDEYQQVLTYRPGDERARSALDQIARAAAAATLVPGDPAVLRTSATGSVVPPPSAIGPPPALPPLPR
jgi:Flp pilus assembly protein TadD